MTKKEICEILKIDNGTLKNWERDRPELHTIVMKHFEKEKIFPDFNDPKFMINEITKDLEKLPLNQIKIIFYTIKTKLAEMGH